MKIILLIIAFILINSAAEAKTHKHHGHHVRHHYSKSVSHHAHHHYRRVRHLGHYRDHTQRSGLVTVQTAAGVPITVASHLVRAFQGFIQDVVTLGYRPRHIGCYARGGHVPNSNHYRGAACDFDQRGWGLTNRIMYHVTQIAQRWGLNDGCRYVRRGRGDCGHIDAPGGVLR